MKIEVVAALLILFSFYSRAQSDKTLAPKEDSSVYNFEDGSVYDFLIVDSRYQNQFAFWGRNYGQRIPFLSSNLMYYSHSGIWVNASSYYFFDEAVPLQFGLTLGYLRELSPRVDWHLSYSQFYVPSSTVSSDYKTQGYVQSTIGFDWNVLFSSIQIHALLNKNSDLFLTTYHSRYFEFNDKLWKKIKVSFEPKFSFTFGTHHFEYADGLVVGPGGGVIISPTANSDLGGKVQILNYDFLFPLKFEIGTFSIEPAWRFTHPLYANTASEKGLHIFTMGLNYYLPIKKR